MSYQCILYNPPSTNPYENQPQSTFTPPMFVEMGDEGSENLEAMIKEKVPLHSRSPSVSVNSYLQTGETVKADEDWTRLSGTRFIDSSIIGGFLLQTDAGSGCSIQVTENGNLPVQILIDEEQDFSMFLVATLRHEEWTTSRNFHLRFLRRVPVSDKRCTIRIDVNFTGSVQSSSEDPGTSSPEEPGSSASGIISVQDGKNEKKEADQATGTNTPHSAQTSSHTDAYLVPLAGRTGSPKQNEDLTDEEEHSGRTAAGLKGTGGGIIPPGMFPPPK